MLSCQWGMHLSTLLSAASAEKTPKTGPRMVRGGGAPGGTRRHQRRARRAPTDWSRLWGAGVSSDGEVVVVGGGPTGLTTALLLAHHGVACTVLERRTAPSRTPRARAVTLRTMEVLRGLGLADEITAAAVASERTGLPFTFARTLAEAAPAQTTTMFRRGTRAEQSPCTTVMCPQDVVERILLARIATTRSIRLRRGMDVRGVDVHGDEVLVHTADDNPLLARYVVGADGASSPIRRACGPADRAERGGRCGGRTRRRQHAGAVRGRPHRARRRMSAAPSTSWTTRACGATCSRPHSHTGGRLTNCTKTASRSPEPILRPRSDGYWASTSRSRSWKRPSGLCAARWRHGSGTARCSSRVTPRTWCRLSAVPG